MLYVFIKFDFFVELVHIAVDSCTKITALSSSCKKLFVLTFSASDNRRKDLNLGALGK